EQLDVQAARRERRQEVVEVTHVEDVVHDLNLAARMTLDDERQLLERARPALAAELHRLAIEPAEGAVLLLAPPAAARGLEEEPGLPAALEAGRVEFGEEVVEIGVGQRVH